MPNVRDWQVFDETNLLIVADYNQRNYRAEVRRRFEQECLTRGYEVRPSVREGNSKGLQAFVGDKLVGEFTPRGSTAWVLK